ncbi:MAG: hypothetical protein ACREDD_03745 [Methylocella sp.]
MPETVPIEIMREDVPGGAYGEGLRYEAQTSRCRRRPARGVMRLAPEVARRLHA